LLYYGRKFDIRMWILIDHKNNVFIFKYKKNKNKNKYKK
jgi:hypothetical protein